MKILFLCRHAKSEWPGDNTKDFDRTLNSRGFSDAPEMGKILKARENEISYFISSPAKRAITTAALIAAEMNYPVDKVHQVKELYHADVKDFLSVIGQIPDDKNSAIIFSHNPGITDVVNYLGSDFIGNIPTCGIVKINFPFDSWKEVSAESGTMDYFDFPKNH